MSRCAIANSVGLHHNEFVVACVISLSDGNNIRSNRGSSEWELIIVNSVDNSFALTPARASDRIAAKRTGFWYERARISLSDEIKDIQEADKKEIPIVLLCKEHHVSRKWFYKWKKRKMRRRRFKVPDKSSSQDAQ